MIAPKQFPEWEHWEGAEVHLFPAWGWVNAILKVERVDKAQHTLIVDCGQEIWPGNRFFIANVREALDAPGEWYLDALEGKLLYWPTSPDFSDVEVVVPAMDRLLILQGNASEGRFVEHLRFRGLTFADADYTALGGYYSPADAAIWMVAARQCVVENCTFRHLGGYAVRWSGENLSRAASIYESEEALMRSPGHRANILAPQPTRVGIGVVSAPPGTRPRWVVTQIFARPLRKLSSSNFASEARRTFSVNLPSGAGASVPRNREVDRIAEQIARRLHAGEIDQEAAADEAGRLLNDAGIAFRKLTVLSYEVPEPTDIAVPEEASGPHVKAVGIGAIGDPKSLLTLAVELLVVE